eukprot:Opistho-1_new@95695
MSNSWWACLTTETRCPARRRRATSCSTSVVLPEPEYPQKPTTFIRRQPSCRAILDDVGLHRRRTGRHDLEAPGELLQPLEPGRPGRLVAERLEDGGGELDRQRGLQHQQRRAGLRVRTAHLQAVGGVRIDGHAEALLRVADGRHAVGVRALAGHEAELAHPRELGGRQREAAVPRDVVAEQLAGARRVAPQQVEHEALEVAGLGDVHRRAGGLVRVGRAAHAVTAGAEELVEHVVLVGGDHQLLDRQAHHARHMAGADVAEVARGHREAHPLVVRLRGLEVPGEVIHHLRQQPRPVDGVDRADAPAALELEVVGDGLDDVLAVV